MTMLNTNRRDVITSSGGTVFAYTFKIYDESHIKVIVADSDGQNPSTKLLNTDYTVDGVKSASGGNVTFTASVTAGKKVILILDAPLKQESDLTSADRLPAETLEETLDRLASEIVTLKARLDRALILPESTPATSEGILVPDYNIVANQSKVLRLGASGIEAVATVGSVQTDVMTTKGDLPTRNSSAVIRLPVGADYTLLMADAAQASGLAWTDIHNVPGVTGVIGGLQASSNLIHNTQMSIWQRGTTFTSPTDNTVTADRWRFRKATTAGNVTITRSTDVPTVTSPETMPQYSLRVACTTADGTVDSVDRISIQQKITGGTWRAYAQRPFTVSFWVKSNKTGTYALALNNAAKDRAIVTNFTINAASTWEWKFLTIPASPSAGTWAYTENPTAIIWGLTIDFVLMAGTGLGSTVNNTWTTMAAVEALRTSTANVNFMDSTSNFINIYGVQADIGVASVSQRTIAFNDDLRVCRRFFRKTFHYDVAPAQNAGTTGALRWRSTAGASTVTNIFVQLEEPMAMTPLNTTYNPSAANAQVRNVTLGADCSVTFVSGDANRIGIGTTTTAATAVNNELEVHFTSDSDYL